MFVVYFVLPLLCLFFLVLLLPFLRAECACGTAVAIVPLNSLLDTVLFFFLSYFLFHSFFQFFVVSPMFVFKINEKQVLYLRLHVCVCVVRVIRYRLRIMKNSVVVSAEALAF